MYYTSVACKGEIDVFAGTLGNPEKFPSKRIITGMNDCHGFLAMTHFPSMEKIQWTSCPLS